ncbi:lamin tail domain-containing protein [Candidatus Wolfebacteria bacterium]|nr:lamin tail domain-containing protein [Candidatus Wolfebacteria bacterium]
MAKRCLIFGLIVFAALPFSRSVFAYDDKTTHPALTQEIADFYNLTAGTKLMPEQKEWLIEGSTEEDLPPRWINHFYDPTTKAGWTGENAAKIYSSVVRAFSFLAFSQEAPISAVQWAKNPLIQERYKFYGGDRTWQKALEYYANGNEKEAYKTLGYILHLLEDMAVPDHTRNDTHAHLDKLGDEGSPYEDYAQKYTRQTIKNFQISENLKEKNLQPVSKQFIEDYLISMADYSNKYFFSKDTINDSKYQLPKIVKEDSSFGYGRDELNNEFPLVLISEKTGETVDSVKEYSLKDKEEYYPILDAYFIRLSRQAVLHGAGAIELFKKKAEEAIINKEYPAHLVKYDFSFITPPVISFYSIWDAAFGKAKSAVAGVGSLFQGVISSVTNLFANDGFTKVDEISVNENTDEEINNASDAALSRDAIPSVTQDKIAKAPKAPKKEKAEESSPFDEEIIQEKPLLTKRATTTPDTVQEDGKEGEGERDAADPAVRSVKSETTSAPLSECQFDTNQTPTHSPVIINEVAWMGGTAGAANEWIELKNISTTSVNLRGWRVANKKGTLKIDLTQMKKTLLSAGGFALFERTDDQTLPGLAADFIYTGGMANQNEKLRLFDGNCNVIDDVAVSPDWPGGNDTTKQTMERKIAGFGWQTSLAAGGTPKRENSEGVTTPVQAVGGGSSLATVAAESAPTTPSKISITEVQITGGAGKTNNDFIEIYNPQISAVNLNGYRLVKRTKNGTTDTSIKSWTSDAVIPAGGYYLWANSDYTDIPATPDSTTSATLASDNGIAIRFGPTDTGEIIDAVGWGEAENVFVEGGRFSQNPGAGASIGRKLESGAFTDTNNNANDFEIRTCPSPKAETRTCGTANRAPTAFFVYAPTSPVIEGEVIFNAASSSDPDGAIASYAWDFGDGRATSTASSSAVHAYDSAGIFTVSLTVRDGVSASSTATSSLTVASPPGRATRIVISEILFDAAGSDEGKEFIELYNPTAQPVNISSWSMRMPDAGATTTTSLVTIGSKPEDATVIPAHGFFLIGFNNYVGTTTPDAVRSVSLPNDVETIILVDAAGSEIDRVNYAGGTEGQSRERQAFTAGECASAEGAGEFFGNGCDRGADDDFAARERPRPQNSASLMEPRSAPPVPSFSAEYISSTVEVVLAWGPSSDATGATSTMTYEVQEYNSPGVVIHRATSTPAFRKIVDEVGRGRTFSVQAFDRDGLGSALASTTIVTPSFFSQLHVYEDPRASGTFLLDARSAAYPFIPDLYQGGMQSSWKLLVFYLNAEAVKQEHIFETWQPSNIQNVLPVAYRQCSGGSMVIKKTLILADIASRCGTPGGAYNEALDIAELEDPHLMISLPNLTGHARWNASSSAENYITVAFYAMMSTLGSDGRVPFFRLVAVDKTKYFVGNEPARAGPELGGPLTAVFNAGTSRIALGWPTARDADTLDNLIVYEIQYASSTAWQMVGNATTRLVTPGDSLDISVRAKDDFGVYSTTTLGMSWTYPAASFSLEQAATDGAGESFGFKDGTGSAKLALQEIRPDATFAFDTAVLKIKHTMINDAATLKLTLYPASDGVPDFSSPIVSSTLASAFKFDGTDPIAFTFNTPIPLTAGTRYWLALEVERYNGDLGASWFRNSWDVATTGGNAYAAGESGRVMVQGGAYNSFSLDPARDWYMKLAKLE